VVFDREGNFITEWGKGVLTDAHGFFISGDDYIYLPVREAHAVVKYTLDGRPMFTMGLWDKPSDTGGIRPYGTVQRAAGPFNRCIGAGYGRYRPFIPGPELWGRPPPLTIGGNAASVSGRLGPE
jgi:hypothetical protein